MPLPPHYRALAAALLLAAPLGTHPAPSRLDGTWMGSLTLELPFRILLHVRSAGDTTIITADFPDQGTRGIRLPDVVVAGDSVHMALPPAALSFDGRLTTGADSLVGIFVQGLQRFPLVLTRPTAAQLAELARPQEPPRPYPYRDEPVRITTADAGVTLVGTLTRLDDDRRHAAIVLAAGAGPLDRDAVVAGHRPFLVLADALTRRGFVVLRLDKRGVGRSTGSFATATIGDFARDLAAAVAHLRTLPNVDPARVGVLGHSEGALVAAKVAAADPRIAFTVLLTPPALRGDRLMIDRAAALFAARGVPASAIAKDGALRRALFDALLAPDTTNVRARVQQAVSAALGHMTDTDRAALGYGPAEWTNGVEVFLAQVAWFRAWLADDPLPAYRALPGDVLAVFGERDQQVPAASNATTLERTLAQRAGAPRGRRATVLTLPALNHQMQTASTGSPAEYGRIPETLAPALLDRLGAWLDAVRGTP